MDISKNGAVFSLSGEFMNGANFGDTTLRLDCFGYGGNRGVVPGENQNNLNKHVTPAKALDDGCKLVLGLGPTPNSDYFPDGGTKRKGHPSILNQDFLYEDDSILKLGLSGNTDEISSILNYSASMSITRNDQVFSGPGLQIPVVDEGSTSAKRSGGYMPSLLMAPRMEKSKLFLDSKEPFQFDADSNCHVSQISSEPSAVSDYSMCTMSEPSGCPNSSDNRTSNPKRCKFPGCSKGARGATGLCIGHGGGQRCQKPGCNKGAESRTAYCKAHGGGKRCQHLGCTKSAEGKTDYCIAHGGGRRCEYPKGCTKAARGKSGLCIKHGGGKRCKVEGCTRSAEGQIGLCISHGGGRRCQFHGCSKGAQGSTLYCKAHGGGKRCIFSGCTKGAEGSTPLCKAHGGGKRCMFDGGGICPKSVHGGTNYCVAHGGGKRCDVPGCTKSARGRTSCCVRHGGGKRCKIENCGKSAQGSTDFCKAHGGGKRCSWGEGKCEKFARGRGGLCAAHSSLVNGREKNKGSMIGPGLFHGLVHAASNGSTFRSSFENSHSSSAVSVVSDTEDSQERTAKRQQLLPPQLLVPLSMKASLTFTRPSSSENQEGRSTRASNDAETGFEITEGRVHGGGLMSLFGGSIKNAINGI
ncbi:hypothetical protein LIER_06487 [Lithospermum erythrorhizon]|uniref:WRKY19-like zinc finger domain-containing protein n=1 Tax=Lithospermum erythrorhizon TaxID=34254 RepID=A0AAV3P4P8_LITER